MSEQKKTAKKVIDLLEKRGIDKGYVHVNGSVKTELNIDNGRFSLMRTTFMQSLNLTIFNNGRKGTARVNTFDDETISKAVDDCILASDSVEPDDAWTVAPFEEERQLTSGSFECDKDRLFERAVEFMEDTKKKHPKINLQQVIFTHVGYDNAFSSTSGSLFGTDGGFYSISIMYTATDGNVTTSFAGTGCMTKDLDRPFLELSTIDSDFTDLENQIETKAIEGKFEGSAIFTPGSVDMIMSVVLNMFCNGFSVMDGTSVWKDKLGQKVCDERITVSLNPHDSRIVLGESWSNEGFLSEDYDVIRDGKLESFCMNAYTAKKTGNRRSPNTGGEVIVKAGEIPYADMIKNVKRGLIVGRFSGGNPSPNGDFSGVAKNSFYVEDGEIKYAVSETMINGNINAMLNNVKDISAELYMDGSRVRPAISFDGITISGK